MIYQPYTKPNSKVVYVHHQSNHPPSILKNIPEAVNKRISDLSQNEDIFNKHKQTYQTALDNCGYKYSLKFNPSQQKDQQKRTRSRKIIWFNPPYSRGVASNVGKQFLDIVDQSFPKSHPLHKIFNSSFPKSHPLHKIFNSSFPKS